MADNPGDDQGIDPRLRDAIQSTQAFPCYSPPAHDQSSTSIRLPPPTTHAQHAQQQHYAPWPPNAYNPYYGPPIHQQSLPLQAPNGYQPYQAIPTAPILPPTDSGTADSTKRLRACEACRGLKVRCEPDPNGGACKRCVKAGRNCLITAPTRKRQKKSDGRVSELEQKIEALTATLQAARDGQDHSDDDNLVLNNAAHLGSLDNIPVQPTVDQGHQIRRQPYPGYQQLAAYANMSTAGRKRSISECQKKVPQNALDRSTDLTLQRDTEDYHAVDETTAAGLVDLFRAEFQSCIPVVNISSSASASQQSKPTLQLAVLSAASRQSYATLHKKMTCEITKTLADRVVVKGEKSLELIQALQISAIWCWRPDVKDSSLPLPLVQLATSMAMELGLDRHNLKIEDVAAETDIAINAKESARAWLGCYLLCSIATMDLERPSIVRFSARLEDCLSILEEVERIASDRVLCDLVRLQKLAEDFIAYFTPDAFAAISATKIRNAYKDFERKLLSWDKQTPNESKSSLSLAYHVIKLYMHEIAQYAGSLTPKIHGSKANGQLVTSPSSSSSSKATTMTFALGVLDAFLDQSASDARYLPAFQHFQLAHAGVSLLKARLATTDQDTDSTEVQISDSTIDERLSGVLHLLRTARPGTAASEISTDNKQNPTSVEQRLFDSIAIDRANHAGHSADLVRGLEGFFILLQVKWDRAKAEATRGSNVTQDKSETANRALHLLSEVAMGNKSNSGENEPPRAEGAPQDASAEVELEKLFQKGEHALVKDKMISNVFQRLATAGTTS